MNGKNVKAVHKRFAREFGEQGRYIVEKCSVMLRDVYYVKDRDWNGAEARIDKDEPNGVEYILRDKEFDAFDIGKLNELMEYVEGGES